MIPGRKFREHNDGAKGVWTVNLFPTARGNSGSNANYSEDTDLQLRFAWCMTGFTMGEKDSEERRRSKEQMVLLMTSLRDLMINEGAAVACANRRDALCFVRFILEQLSEPALITCAKTLREGSELVNTLLSQVLMDINQGRPMRVNMKKKP